MSVVRINIAPMGAVRTTQRGLWDARARKYAAYKEELRHQLPGYELGDELHIYFYIQMPKSWSEKKKREMDDKPHKQRPDIDNLIKGFMDAMSPEDSSVWTVYAEKRWQREAGIAIELEKARTFNEED